MAKFVNKLKLSNLIRDSSYSFVLRRSQLSTMAGYPVNSIPFDSLKDKVLKGDVTLIDVREPKELKDDGKIPNSVNIPLGQIVNAFQLSNSEFLEKYGINKPAVSDNFVISCRSGKRATNAFNELFSIGFKNALVYTGSFQDWLKNGGPIEK